MYNFFVEEKNIFANKIIIEGKDYNHIVNVLRMTEGETIKICNKSTSESFLTKISKIEKEEIECSIIEKLETTEPKQKITIFQGIPKSDKMEYIIQKSVELGMTNLVPVQMKFCIAKINNAEKKINRWQAIAESAAKQSKRNIIPKIENPISINQLIDKIKEYDLAILAYENESKMTIKKELQENKNAESIAVIIGPEGGISEDEKDSLVAKGAKCVSLGKRILRSETASSAILSMIMYENEL